MEMNIRKLDEGKAILATMNASDTTKKILSMFDIPITDEEVEYMKNNWKISNTQKKLIQSFVAKFYGNFRDTQLLTRNDFCTLALLIKKKLLIDSGYEIGDPIGQMALLPFILTGNMWGKATARIVRSNKYFGKLEKLGKVKAVVTQNIDNLHQLGGSKNVIELHGSIMRNYCMNCHTFYDLNSIYTKEHKVPKCKICGGTIKPDVVLYEEGLDEKTITDAIRYISNAEMLIVVGTSLMVYPAAGFLRYFKGKYLVLINKSSTSYDSNADILINDDIKNVIDYLEK